MRRQDLYVEPAEAAAFQMLDQKEQCELRGVRAQVEHALAGERAARVHAVDAADQLLALPRLDAVRAAAAAKLAVAADHLRRDPGSLLVRSRGGRARRDDALEGSVNREAQGRAPAFAREASRHVQLVET